MADYTNQSTFCSFVERAIDAGGMTYPLAARAVNTGRIELMAGDLEAADTTFTRARDRLSS